MLKVLVTLPNSIGGALVLKGFSAGFKSNGCFVFQKDLRELTVKDVQRFKPDIIFGYDYGFLFSDDEELKDYIIENNSSYKLVHYFADEPKGKYACVNKPELYEQFGKIDAYSFVWDREFVKDLENAHYLPLAVNYKAYRPLEGPHYDISFVGRPLTDERQKHLAALIKAFGSKVNIFSYEKHFLQSIDDMKNKQLLTDKELEIYKNAYKGFLKTEEEVATVYLNSTVNINHTIQGKSGLNYRVFGVLASRGFLLTDYMSDIEQNFVVSKELEVFNSIEDMIDKTDFYLKHPEIAQRIGVMGFANVTKSHNYTARVHKILKTIRV